LLGRRRFEDLEDDFSILETKEECLIFCLSFFEEGKEESSSKEEGVGRAAVGRATRADFARAVVRFLIGAYIVQHSRLWYRMVSWGSLPCLRGYVVRGKERNALDFWMLDIFPFRYR
jgi:hypothetical protein